MSTLAATAPITMASRVSAASQPGSSPVRFAVGLSEVSPAPAAALTDAAPTIMSRLVETNMPTPAASPVRTREVSAGR